MTTESFEFVSFGIFFAVATFNRLESENDLRVVVLVGIEAVDDRFRAGRGCKNSPMLIRVTGRDSIFREAASVKREFVSSSLLFLSVGKLLTAGAITRVGPKCRLKKSGTILRIPDDLVSFVEPEPG